MSSPIPLSLQSKLQRSPAISRIKSFSSTLSLLRNLVFVLFLLGWTRKSFYFLRGHGLLGSVAYTYVQLRKRAYKLFLALPPIARRVDREVGKSVRGIEEKLLASEKGLEKHLILPKEGFGKDRVGEQLDVLQGLKRTRWEEGKVSGAVYHGEDGLLDVQIDAMRRFMVSNPIHSDVFPSIRKMESEIIAMTLALFNAPPGGAGATTSGGTESILMACLSARQKAYVERGVTEPEMIISKTAHAAFHKAAQYFRIKLHILPAPEPNHTISLPHVRSFINPNTILIVGSCPNYPTGIIDDIPALSAIAVSHKIPLHVDCCLGSFLLPFLSASGFPAPFAEQGGFDFRQPGVTSISVDTHKYGFAPKGNSVVLYRSVQLRQYGYFVAPDWTGGVYGSPTMAGSRPGALIAGCWASLLSLGEKGYIEACHAIVGTRQTIQNAVAEHPTLTKTLRIMGKPEVSVVAFESADPEISIYDVADAMSAKGYHLNSIQDPPGLHVAVTLPMTKPGAVDELIDTLVAVVQVEQDAATARQAQGVQVGVAESAVGGGAAADANAATLAEGTASVARRTKRHAGKSGQLYGVAGSLPDKSVVERLVVGYLDTLYKT